jgi:hypothetical protein
MKVARAQRDVCHLLEEAVVIRDEEVPLRGLELVPEHTSREMKGDWFTVSE